MWFLTNFFPKCFFVSLTALESRHPRVRRHIFGSFMNSHQARSPISSIMHVPFSILNLKSTSVFNFPAKAKWLPLHFGSYVLTEAFFVYVLVDPLSAHADVLGLVTHSSPRGGTPDKPKSVCVRGYRAFVTHDTLKRVALATRMPSGSGSCLGDKRGSIKSLVFSAHIHCF